jgi:hypothetical protein
MLYVNPFFNHITGMKRVKAFLYLQYLVKTAQCAREGIFFFFAVRYFSLIIKIIDTRQIKSKKMVCTKLATRLPIAMDGKISKDDLWSEEPGCCDRPDLLRLSVHGGPTHNYTMIKKVTTTSYDFI